MGNHRENMREPQSPCLGCEARSANCHPLCPDYGQYVYEHGKYKAWLREMKAEKKMHNEYVTDHLRRGK